MVAPLALVLAPLIAKAGPALLNALKSPAGRHAAGMVAGKTADAGTRAGAAGLRACGVNVPPGVEQVVAGLASQAAGMGAAGGFARAGGVTDLSGRDNSTTSYGQYTGTGQNWDTPRPQPRPQPQPQPDSR